jgi:segregation and condensation protein A
MVVGKPSASEIAPAEIVDDTPVDIEDLQLIDLMEAFAKVVESVDFSRVGEHRVVMDDTPAEVYGERIVERLRAAGASDGLGFASLFTARTRSELIGMFLALLELVRQQRISVRQETVAGEITLHLSEDPAAAPPAPAA